MNLNEKLLDNIKNLKIRYRKQQLEFKDFEELLLKSFIKILDKKNKKSLFIGIEKNLINILLILCLSIKQCYENMKDPDNNILDTIENGDKVFYSGKICIFKKLDIDKKNNKKYIYLLEKDNTKTLVPFENSYLLTVYNGQATRVNKMNGKSQAVNITKKFISKLMNVDISNLNGTIKESTVVVFSNKEELYNLLDSVEIKFGEKYNKIAELFPFAYYSSEENYEYIKGNRIKQNSIIKFVSNISTAVDIIKDDENVKNIILIGEKSYRDSLETELREINMIDSIENILVADTWESKFDFSLLINDDEPFCVNAISKEVVLDNVNLYDKSLLDLRSNLQRKNYNLIENLVNKYIQIYEVDNSEILNSNIYDINESLKTLFYYSQENLKVLDFIKLTYHLCNKLEQSILPLNKCKDNFNNLTYKINLLKDIATIFPQDRVEYKLMVNIIVNIKKIINFLENKNYKLETMKENILSNKKSLLYTKNVDEIIKMEEYFRRFRKINLDIKKVNKKLNFYGNKNLIIPGFFENNYTNILNTNKVENINIIVYRREKIKIRSLIRKNTEMLNLVLENNKLLDNEDFELPTIIENFLVKSNSSENKLFYNNEEEFNEFENEVQKIIQENKIKLFINEDKSSRGVSTSIMKVHKIINFEDDNYSFLSDNYQVNIVDRNNNDIKHKGISELNIGDEMIFTKSKLSGEEDIVKVVIKELLSQEEFNNVYGEYFRLNNLWKNCLKNYMHKYDLTEKDISNEFKIFGKQITHSAIVNWLNGNIIGPQNVDDIRIIAKIVNDKELNEKIEQVIGACKQERSIQIHIRKAIAKIIISSMVKSNESNSDIYKIVKNAIIDLDKYAYVGIISSIKNIDEELSSQHVNKVIERDE
ncbi:DrmE family protein [Clostridium botulinum]|uniref:DrmE family protein n=1 Tax=Clostridium botulinum TaxID=1491 RepID=UPI000774DA65|nr:DrmE family protein [Clostridium botulinum]